VQVAALHGIGHCGRYLERQDVIDRTVEAFIRSIDQKDWPGQQHADEVLSARPESQSSTRRQTALRFRKPPSQAAAFAGSGAVRQVQRQRLRDARGVPRPRVEQQPRGDAPCSSWCPARRLSPHHPLDSEHASGPRAPPRLPWPSP